LSACDKRELTIAQWYAFQRQWPRLPAAPLTVQVEPAQVRAAGPCVLRVSFEATADLPPGATIYFELPHGWGKFMGRVYPTRGLQVRGRGIMPGMGLLADAFGPEGTSWNEPLQVFDLDRFKVLALVVPEAGLAAGQSFTLVLGSPPGAPVQAQKWAQRCVFTCGCDVGDGVLLPVRPQPAVQVVGGPPAHLGLYAPATVAAGEDFTVHIEARDPAYWNPSADYERQVTLYYGGEITGPQEATVRAGAGEAKCRVGKGVGWLSACDNRAGLCGLSNPIAADFFAGGQRVFFGDLHGQVYDSIGAGTHDEYFRWARDVEHLDFCAPANHYGGRAEADEETWRRCVETTNWYDKPGDFVTLVAYEWGGPPGHRNVYFAGDHGPLVLPRSLTSPSADTPAELIEHLRAGGHQFFLVPHHPNFCSPVDWSFRSDEHQRLVEISSQWGISEEGPVHSVQAALAMGHRLGFVGGSDTHYGTPGRGGHGDGQLSGLTAVLAQELSREALWEALYQRRCYAVFGERLLLDFAVQGLPMGSEAVLGPEDSALRRRTIRAKVATRTPLQAVEIIRTGEVIHRVEPGGQRYAEVVFEDTADLGEVLLRPTLGPEQPFCYYYLRVTTRAGHFGWSSPVWFTVTDG